MEQILTEAEANITESPYYWVAGRSRSLPRHLDTTGYSREFQDRSDWETERREEINKTFLPSEITILTRSV